MMKNQATSFERLKTSLSKQSYESPCVKVVAFGKQDVVCSSGGAFVQEPFIGGDTYGYDFELWD